MELLHQGDVWTLGIARKPMFSRTKWPPASMGGTSFVRRVQLALGRLLHCKVRFRCADRIVMAVSLRCLQPWSTKFYCHLQGSDCRSHGMKSEPGKALAWNVIRAWNRSSCPPFCQATSEDQVLVGVSINPMNE